MSWPPTIALESAKAMANRPGATFVKGYAINWRTYQAYKFNSTTEANAFADDEHMKRGKDVGTYAFPDHLSRDFSVTMEQFIALHNKLADKLKFRKVTVFETRQAAAEQLIWMLAKLPLSNS